jgi:FKBP-type peptidyl-prolyl cis-trans isomerase FkpA
LDINESNSNLITSIMKRPLILLLFSITILISISSCNKTKQYEKEEQEQINAYLERNSSIDFERKPSGLYYHVLVAGTGRVPVKSDTVNVKYTGKFLDGSVFDTNVGTTKTLEVIIGAPGLIEGFAEGITYMAEGGKSLLLMPSSLGYGTVGVPYGGISGYTPLLFEVELVRVRPGKGK